MKMFKKQLIALMLITCLFFNEFATIISCSLDTEGEIETETVLFANDYKSKLYENYYSGKQNDFKYTLEHELEFLSKDDVNEIELNEDPDVFLLGEEEINLEPYMYYNFVLVSVKSFNEIFGESGKLEFYDGDNELIGEISADMNKPDDEFYICDFEKEYSQIKYKVTKPTKSGKLEMKVQKTIKPELVQNVSYEDFRNIKQIKNRMQLSYIKDNSEREVIEEKKLENVIDLKEPTTKVELSSSEKTLNALEENKVNFNITLKNSYYENELFENPTVEIELPDDIETIKIDKIMLLYRNGLSLADWYIKEENEKKYIEIELKGKQEEYQNSEIIDGTNIVLATTIKVKNTTSIKKSELKLRYTNSNKEINYSENLDYDSYEIEFMSRYGLLAMSEVKNSNNEELKVLSIGDEINSIKLDMDSEAQNLDFNMTVVNNYTECLENVEILGSFPIENNEKLELKDLKNTYSMNLLTTIGTLGVENKIYYSNEINPKSDSETWTENIEELEQISSYKIEIEKLEPEQFLKFYYQEEAPENLTYNQASYSYYEVSYDYNGQRMTSSSTAGAETERKDVTYRDCQVKEETDLLNIGLYASKGGKALEDAQEVHEGQIIDYAIVLVNNTDEAIENIGIDTILNNGNFYEWKQYFAIEGDESSDFYLFEENSEKELDSLSVESLEAHETKIINYSAVIRNKNDEQDIYSNVKVKLNDENLIEKDTIKNSIKDSRVNVRIAYANNEGDEITSQEVVRSALYINNKTDEEIEELEFNLEVSTEVALQELLIELTDIDYEIVEQKVENGKTKIILKLFNILPGELGFAIPFNILNYDETKVEDDVFITGSYNYQDEKYDMNNYKRTIKKRNGEITGELTCNSSNDVLTNGDELSYTYTVTNTGIIPMDASISISSDLGLDIRKYEVVKSEEIIDSQDNISTTYIESTVNLDVNESAQIVAYATYNDELSLYDQENIGIVGSVHSYNLVNLVSSNKFNYQIDKKDVIEEEENIDEKIEESEEQDDNIDIEEEFEEKHKLIEQQSSAKKNEENTVNTIKTVKIEEGNNLVNVFEQSNDEKINDSEIENPKEKKYKISGQIWLDQNKNGLKDNDEPIIEKVSIKLYENSKELKQLNDYVALTMVSDDGSYCFNDLSKGKYIVVFEYDNKLYDITLYDQSDDTLENSSAVLKNINNKDVAVTNVIDLEESSKIDVNLGLCDKEKFDLKINANISSINIKNEKENRTTTYSGENLTKEEIDAKYLAGTDVTVNYKIVVSNVGDISGYANEIIDYLPEGFDFNNELNSGWYLENNILHNTSLNNIEIKPGEKKTLNLVLTKTMDEESTGTFTNKAEIKLSTNSKKLNDCEKSNNKDEVTLILSIKTGKIFVYTLIIFANLLIIACGVWIIKKKIL